ncbi:MAG: ABC transporter ATP-binding protein [Clostridiales bacterium]|nr:ABC transporter ATP-binding protein [Clostridiales bacterium]
MKNDIEMLHIDKFYGDSKILEDFSLKFPRNQITCIVGPSGCGKSTILNIIAGLSDQDKGKVTNIEESLISYAFQDPRLLPWRNAKDNLRFILKNKMNETLIDNHIDYWLDSVELNDYKDYFPNQLSGGMMQRLSLARAFAFPSNLLLMDEPFKGLDAPLRHKMIALTRKLWQQENKTIVFVTHDIQEALLIGHRVVALGGKPASILDELEIDIPVEDRKIGCVKLARHQGYLYDLIEHGSLGVKNCPRIQQIKNRFYDQKSCEILQCEKENLCT